MILQEVTRSYQRLQWITRDYGVTVGTRGYNRIERVTGVYNGFLGLQGVPRG